MSRTCRLDLIDAARPGLFDRLARHQTALAIIGGALFAALVILAAVHHIDRDAEQLAELAVWQRRAVVAEAQVAEIIRTGDGGLVLARLETVDMGRVELSVRPVGRGGQ